MFEKFQKKSATLTKQPKRVQKTIITDKYPLRTLLWCLL